MEDHYRILGLDRGSSVEEIKKAYRKLARRYHPDVNPGDARAEAHFRRVSAAYEILSDPARRELYDRFGDQANGSHDSMRTEARRARAYAEGARIRDLFSDLFRSPGGAAPPGGGSATSADLHTAIDVEFEDAIRGVTTKILVRREVTCSACEGRGGERSQHRVRCPTCGGSGRVRTGGIFRAELKVCSECAGNGYREPRRCSDCAGRGLKIQEETLTVKVPAGVDNGSKVRVAGRGNVVSGGAAPGDLYVSTRVRPHRHLTREGDSLFLRVPITLTEAMLGTKISVPTVDGQALIKVPQGTQSGQRFRLRERGAPSLRTGERGDLFVEVNVLLPLLKDERSREIMRELARLNPEDPRKGLFE